MRRRTFHAPHPFGKINVTPMIDVVMCLIVFYLIVGRLASDQRSGLQLPESRIGHTDKAQELLIINILSDGRIIIEAHTIPAAALQAAIRERLALKPDVVVEVRGARDLPYSAISGILEACKQAGVASVRLATERGP
jgi:biopolymer transport protein ExbD